MRTSTKECAREIQIHFKLGFRTRAHLMKHRFQGIGQNDGFGSPLNGRNVEHVCRIKRVFISRNGSIDVQEALCGALVLRLDVPYHCRTVFETVKPIIGAAISEFVIQPLWRRT